MQNLRVSAKRICRWGVEIREGEGSKMNRINLRVRHACREEKKLQLTTLWLPMLLSFTEELVFFCNNKGEITNGSLSYRSALSESKSHISFSGLLRGIRNQNRAKPAPILYKKNSAESSRPFDFFFVTQIKRHWNCILKNWLICTAQIQHWVVWIKSRVFYFEWLLTFKQIPQTIYIHKTVSSTL